jgi:hypothetical protein
MKILGLLFRPVVVAFCVSLPLATAYSAVPSIVIHEVCQATCDGAQGLEPCTNRIYPNCGTQAVCKGTGEAICEDCTCGHNTTGRRCQCEQ